MWHFWCFELFRVIKFYDICANLRSILTSRLSLWTSHKNAYQLTLRFKVNDFEFLRNNKLPASHTRRLHFLTTIRKLRKCESRNLNGSRKEELNYHKLPSFFISTRRSTTFIGLLMTTAGVVHISSQSSSKTIKHFVTKLRVNWYTRRLLTVAFHDLEAFSAFCFFLFRLSGFVFLLHTSVDKFQPLNRQCGAKNIS